MAGEEKPWVTADGVRVGPGDVVWGLVFGERGKVTGVEPRQLTSNDDEWTSFGFSTKAAAVEAKRAANGVLAEQRRRGWRIY